MPELWRERLREAVEQSPKKHSAIARAAGMAPATLSRILTGEHVRPSLASVVRIARACNVTLGWLLDEPVRGVELTPHERGSLRLAALLLLEVVDRRPT